MINMKDRVKIEKIYKNINEFDSKEVILCGWVRNIRNSKVIGFIELNDGSFFKPVQIVLEESLENYQEITQNNMDLANFIENYKNNTNSKFKEENNQIIMETTAKTENNYQKYEKLYVAKENGKPTKMEIKDTNQNTIIYIIYNEININKIANEKIYAFKLFCTSKEI